MFQDEDDMLANPLAVSLFIGAVEDNIYKKLDGNENTYVLNDKGEFVIDSEKKPVAIVSGPLFEFDDHHTRVIEASNRIWVNSKLYNRNFMQLHNIQFNEAQSKIIISCPVSSMPWIMILIILEFYLTIFN